MKPLDADGRLRTGIVVDISHSLTTQQHCLAGSLFLLLAAAIRKGDCKVGTVLARGEKIVLYLRT